MILKKTNPLIITWCVLFIIIFPKGGIKTLDIPITWGYITLILLFIYYSLFINIRPIYELNNDRKKILVLLFPFQIFAIPFFILNGTSDPGFTLSFFFSFYFLPFFFIFYISSTWDNKDLSFLFKILRYGILFIASYGIFLFFYKVFTGNFLEIPYLTVNADDAGELESTKHINRGLLFKLISTYNNGNLYGVSTLMLYPLYVKIEKSKWKKTVPWIAFILTLSRSVWACLLLFHLIKFITSKKKNNYKNVFKGISIFLVFFLGILITVNNLNQDASFLFDKDLGGRESITDIDISFTPNVPFEGILEMVYFSVLKQFGILGLIFFIIGIFSPVFINGRIKLLKSLKSTYRKEILIGIILYLCIAFVDGGILYIPIMAIYWWLVSLLMSSNPQLDTSCN